MGETDDAGADDDDVMGTIWHRSIQAGAGNCCKLHYQPLRVWTGFLRVGRRIRK
jgi:hypothetical protein